MRAKRNFYCIRHKVKATDWLTIQILAHFNTISFSTWLINQTTTRTFSAHTWFNQNIRNTLLDRVLLLQNHSWEPLLYCLSTHWQKRSFKSLLRDWHFSLSIIWLFDASLTETLTLLYSWKSCYNWITLKPYRIKESYKILVNHWLW